MSEYNTLGGRATPGILHQICESHDCSQLTDTENLWVQPHIYLTLEYTISTRSTCHAVLGFRISGGKD